jgi:predicted PurR-regulated permease PerM
MDITSFLLGVCAVTVVVLFVVVVVGMFRINKTNKELNDLVRNQDTMDRIIVDEQREIRRTIDSRIDSFGSKIEKEIKFLQERKYQLSYLMI